MKNRYVAVMLGMMLAVSHCTVMATEASVAVENVAEQNPGTQDEAVYGQVTSVQKDSITIEIGTMKEMQRGNQMGGAPEKPEGEEGQSGEKFSEDQPDENGGETPPGEKPGEPIGQPSMLDLTGEEMTITITGNTVITRGGMGGQMGGAGSGQSSEEPDAVPEKREGEDGQASDLGAMGGAINEKLTLSDIEVDDIVSVILDEDDNAVSVAVMSFGMMGSPGMIGGEPGGNSQPENYSAVNEYSEDDTAEGECISSTGSDENAVLVENGANVTLSGATIDRTSADSTGGDASSFYGVGAAVLATDGTAYVTESTITTDSAGGAGIFAYGDGTVYVSDSTINTQQDTSGGIHAAGGGTLYAWNLDVTTNGQSAAAIRSDRGGGTMVVDGGMYTSNGAGSPAVYCTADIAVNNAVLTATGSEAVCIEGLNTLNLFNCDLSGNMSDDSQNDCTWTVIVYQSMSGDSEVGNGTFEMNGGTLTSGNGGMFYTTNTECTITLKDVEIIPSDKNTFFLRCTGNNNQRGWGTAGNNGSDCLFTAIDQKMSGNVVWDSISRLDFYLTSGSSLTGAIVNDEEYAGVGGSGYANVYVDADSIWTVTGDSTLTSLSCEGTITDEEGNTVSIVDINGTKYVSGTSQYTITVQNYSDNTDLSGMSGTTDWSGYETERPEGI